MNNATGMNPLAEALLQMLMAPQAAGQGQAAQPFQQPQTVVNLPYGCTGQRHDGVYLAKSVNDLYSWEDHVQAEDGGTYKGVKVFYVGQDETKKSSKSFSTRQGYMARFEISVAGGRNPMNEVVNIFMKDKTAYRPYLDPAKWNVLHEVVEFRSEDEKEPDRKFKINLVEFDGELISDDTQRRCKHLQSRVGGLYVCYIDGKEFDLE